MEEPPDEAREEAFRCMPEADKAVVFHILDKQARLLEPRVFRLFTR
jgi:hypothetical protein